MADGEPRGELMLEARRGTPAEARGAPSLLAPPLPETPCYLEQGGEQVYAVLHPPARAAVGRVLLCGPLGLERDFAYTTWVRWARHLAHQGIEVLHFDYRGIGESTGELSALGTSAWVEDARLALRFLESQPGGAPVLVHGLRFGALVAAQLFSEGEGDGLLLWDPPSSGREHLQEVLRRKLLEDFGGAGKRRSRSSFLEELEREGRLEVEGYTWGRRLWEESERLRLALPAADEARPWLVVHLDKRGAKRLDVGERGVLAAVPRPPFWGDDPLLVPDLGDLFDVSSGFLSQAARAGREAA